MLASILPRTSSNKFVSSSSWEFEFKPWHFEPLICSPGDIFLQRSKELHHQQLISIPASDKLEQHRQQCTFAWLFVNIAVNCMLDVPIPLLVHCSLPLLHCIYVPLWHTTDGLTKWTRFTALRRSYVSDGTNCISKKNVSESDFSTISLKLV